MNPADHSLQLRQAVVAHLRSVPAVTAIVAANRIYGRRVPDNPTWPFIRYGVPDTRPYEATGQGGSDSAITVHAFARGPDEGACATLAAAIVEALSADQLPLESGLGLVSLDWQRTQVLEDGDESTDYHAIIEFSVVTTG
ncbi:DUF3168 domain-containing protein [Henriciella mobilis]|uniref:DUF3168 domain-containing protein n=1 Tax=Henriciella mobilis TaxID=2305467 RepID=UPI000E66591C|nr:DUF3168 domain-containing protein [Henriciella mobilis]RIJ15948.1 DUF3168 domain-containing protein [Henriciella mobilis]RIJ21158.1 DUF3168 domain-containing protein [Henriciella mobilis]RIJ23141.1 DUF3168 domain-containing protein [Henriciella mobilis]